MYDDKYATLTFMKIIRKTIRYKYGTKTIDKAQIN